MWALTGPTMPELQQNQSVASRFEAIYREGTPPWDIGAPQSEFVQLAEAGEITGPVIDIGCGTGENALYLASRGLDVVGVDGAPIAVERARRKARDRALSAVFEVRDVLDMSDVKETFDSAIDSGCFHVFDDADRPAYVRSVHEVLRPDGKLFLLCFSDRQPGDWGPRRVTQRELRETFASKFSIDSIRAAHFDVGFGAGDGPRIQAWLATISAVP
jgi:SAM-dependent methyltransferase